MNEDAAPTSISGSLELFYDATDQMFVLCDPEFQIIHVNQAMVDRFRLPKEELLGRSILDFAPDNVRDSRSEAYEKVLSTGNSETLLDNSTHPVLGHIYTKIRAFKSGNNLGLVITDITDLKLMRDEHGFLTRLMVSELKSPLTKLMYITNEAVKDDRTNVESRVYFLELNRELMKLDGTLHHIMDVTGSAVQGINLERVELDKILENVLLMFSMNPGVDEIDFQKEIESAADFVADVNAIFYILYELIENAIKFRKPAEYKPFIKMSFGKQGDSFLLTIQDNGVGIAPSKLENLFHFNTDTSETPRGMGFGLFTAFKLVNKLNGLMKINSEPRVGTTVSIYLPLNIELR